MKELRNAFTLIELLVVISIIAILIALLFPVFGIAEEKANRSKCQSNLHQIAVATAQQFGELGDKLPYRGPTDDDDMNFGAAAEGLLPYLKNVKEVLDCPSNPGNAYSRSNDIKTRCKLPSYDFWTDYEFNGYICAYGPPTQFTANKKQNKITDYSLAAYAYDLPYEPGTSFHEDGINIAYLDGHVGWLANSDMTKTNGEFAFFKKGHAY